MTSTSSRANATDYFIRSGRREELPIAIAIDDDAWTTYVELDRRFAVDRSDDHPFVRSELARWEAAVRAGGLRFACTSDRTPVGLLILDTMDGVPHLQQVSVRRAWGRRGVGRMLVEFALHQSAGRELWLTTYDHVVWNQPWYQRLGFVAVPDDACGPETRAVLDLERASLPDPDHRVAMVHRGPRRSRDAEPS